MSKSLTETKIVDLFESQIAITDWKIGDNKGYRHSHLSCLTPVEDADQCK